MIKISLGRREGWGVACGAEGGGELVFSLKKNLFKIL